MKIEEGYSESNATKSECFVAEILELEQNMDFWNRLLKGSKDSEGRVLTFFFKHSFL